MAQGRFALEWLSRDHLEVALQWLKGLIEPARLTILTKSSTLNANLLSKYEYFFVKIV